MIGASGLEFRTFGRRSFLVGAGRGAIVVAVLGLTACRADEGQEDPADTTLSAVAAGLSWSRVDLAYVSAYVLVRGREAAVVDTGVRGSADRIGAVLDATGPGWGGVRHVVVTHSHFDHVGSLGEVADRAAGATLHAGTPELDWLTAPLPDGGPAPVGRHAGRLNAVGDGDEVFGLQVIATPGHTPGHIAVFDAAAAVLVAGDALTNTVDGMLSGSLPEVTVDRAAAADSVRKMAELAPRVILVGHGPPVQEHAAAKLRRLASSQN